MFKRLMANVDSTDLVSRSDELTALADQFTASAASLGLMDENCRTVCEEQLVFENGQLQRKVVCRIICIP
jgi:hypothetical protein